MVEFFARVRVLPVSAVMEADGMDGRRGMRPREREVGRFCAPRDALGAPSGRLGGS